MSFRSEPCASGITLAFKLTLTWVFLCRLRAKQWRDLSKLGGFITQYERNSYTQDQDLGWVSGAISGVWRQSRWVLLLTFIHAMPVTRPQANAYIWCMFGCCKWKTGFYLQFWHLDSSSRTSHPFLSFLLSHSLYARRSAECIPTSCRGEGKQADPIYPRIAYKWYPAAHPRPHKPNANNCRHIKNRANLTCMICSCKCSWKRSASVVRKGPRLGLISV